MVLRKLGSFTTTINVNGTERVSTEQESDRTYDLSETFTTTINVNGTQKVSNEQAGDNTYDLTEAFSIDINVNGSNEGSFTQTGDSQYDVDANTDVFKGSVNEITHAEVTQSADGSENTNGTGEVPPPALIDGNEVGLFAEARSRSFAKAEIGDTSASALNGQFASESVTVSGGETYTISATGQESVAGVVYDAYTTVDAQLLVFGVSQK